MQRSLKKIAFISIGLIFLLTAFFLSKWYLSTAKNLNSVYLIPKDAIYFLASDQPVKNWKKVRDSELWQHLQTNAYFADLSSNVNAFDSILQENTKLFELLGSKKLIISTHPISKYKYDYLFIVDLKKTSKLLQFRTLATRFLSDNYKLSQRKYNGVEILELFDKKTRETLYLAVIDNNLIASYSHTLVETSIDQLAAPVIGRDLKFLEIHQQVKENKLFQMYIQYDYVDDFAYILSKYNDSWLTDISNTLRYSGFDLDLIAGNKIIAKGYTISTDSLNPYLEALSNSGVGKHTIATVAPHRTSMYFSFGFADFSRFYENYTEIQKQHPQQFKSLQSSQKRIENLLDIDVQKNFINWMSDEIALLKLEPINQVEKDNFALVIKANDIALATKNLNYVVKQVKKKTPVKFNEINFKGYPIKFMSIKGFFKMFLGGYFRKLETPYYTILEDYVIFSNHPNTLKYIITSFIEKNTLKEASNYKKFVTNFDAKSNLFIYINTPMIYDALLDKVGGVAKKDLLNNKVYFTSFSQLGLQIAPEDLMLKSKIVIQYKDQESLRFSDEFKSPTVAVDTEVTPAENPIVIQQVDEMQTLTINPKDLNAKSYTKKFPNGKVQVTVPLKDGKKNGMYKEYYKSGILRLKGRFKNDKKTGTWKKYDIHGKLLVKKRYSS